MNVVGLVIWERRHAVRSALPSRTLCGIRTGMVAVDDVPGLTDFVGTAESGFAPCRRCLPMWRRVVAFKDTVNAPGITGDNSIYRNGRVVIGGSAA